MDPTQGQGQLTAAARSLIDAMNKLLTFCSASRPVLKECKGALLDVQVYTYSVNVWFTGEGQIGDKDRLTPYTIVLLLK